MSNNVIHNLFESLIKSDINTLNNIIDENCLLINYDTKAYLGKDKVIKTLTDMYSNNNINNLSLLNTVKDCDDTILIAYSIFKIETSTPVFGSAVIRVNKDKIVHIKNFIVT